MEAVEQSYEYTMVTPTASSGALSTSTSTLIGFGVYSATLRLRRAPVDRLSEAIAVAAGVGASNVSAQTRANAGALLDLLSSKPVPEIVIETSGEVSFEWNKDRDHVAVLSVQGAHVRWAALVGPGNPISGEQVFDGTIPAEALAAVNAAT